MNAEEIAELVEARRASLLEKWANGKKLSEEEADEVHDLLPKPPKGHRLARWARNKVEAGKVLQISRETLDRVLRAPGCPARASDGRYDLPALAAFMGTAGFRAGLATRTDDLAAYKRTRIKFEALTVRLRYQVLTKKVVHIDMVERVWGDTLESLRNAIKENADLTDEHKARLVKKLAESVSLAIPSA